MKFLAVLALLEASMAAAEALTKEAVARTIGAIDLTWTGPVTIGSENITLTGTAESIYKEIIALNPNYDQELGMKTPASLQARELQKRDDIDWNSINCNVPWNECDATPIYEGLLYLYNIGNGICNAPPGSPGNGGCTRVSCSYDAGIWLCNDQSFEARIPCRIIADNAAGIFNRCISTSYGAPPVGPGGGGLGSYVSYVRGQIFSFNHAWNVIVHGQIDC